MMDEHLRDNVERLLKGKPEPPSPEFETRVDSLLRTAAAPGRRMALVPLATIAATVVVAFIFWIAGHENPTPVAVSVKGTITFKGVLPPGKTVKMEGNPECAQYHPAGVVIDPVPVDGDRHVKECLVYVKKGLEGKTFGIPKEPVILAFDACIMKPRTIGIMVGQELVIENREDIFHNAHVLPWRNRETNDGVVEKGQRLTRTFSESELRVKVKCDVHQEWEASWIVVLPHPFFAVTDEHGRYELRGLSPGKYTLEAWQENCTPVTQEIEIKAGPPETVNLDLETPRLDGWSLEIDEPLLKGCEGRVTEVTGTIESLLEGTSTVTLTLEKWRVSCGLAPGQDASLKSLSKDSYVIVRGVFMGRGEKGGEFLRMKDCVIVGSRP